MTPTLTPAQADYLLAAKEFAMHEAMSSHARLVLIRETIEREIVYAVARMQKTSEDYNETVQRIARQKGKRATCKQNDEPSANELIQRSLLPEAVRKIRQDQKGKGRKRKL